MSNNAIIEDEFMRMNGEDGNDPRVELAMLEEKLLQTTRLFKAFRALLRDENFKTYRDLVLGDEQRTLGTKLKSERDPIEMARLQGGLTLLDRIIGVESLERTQDTTIVKIKGRIATIKDQLGITNGTDNESGAD